jgi:23S rRNA (uracil1939-C5)-methyltransferase
MIPDLASGQAGLSDEILDRSFHISAAAFFQVNTLREERELPAEIDAGWMDRAGRYSIADLLALLVLQRLQPEPHQVVVDAYCGVGTFAALVAQRVREVIGIDESKAAIKDAARNTADLSNVRYLAARTEEGLAALADDRIDAVVLDPARVGCSPAVIQALVERRPRRIVYVSCDPATLARDLRLLLEGGYQIERIEPLDMFPQTYHIETVTTLTWTGRAPAQT